MKRRVGVKRLTPVPGRDAEIEAATDFGQLPSVARQAWYEFLRAYKVVLDEISLDVVSNGPITLPEFEILLYISNAAEGRLAFSDLKSRTLLSASQVSRRISALIERGYVSKVMDEADKRASFAVLTDAGRNAYLAALPPFMSSLRRNFFDRIPPGELERFTAIVISLVNRDMIGRTDRPPRV